MSFKKSILLTISALLLSSCASVIPLTDKTTGEDLFHTTKPVYTLVNLHPDSNRLKLYSVNYQQDGLIPLCSQVDIISLNSKRLTFKVKSSDQQYTLDKHKSSPDFTAYLSHYFGTECNTSKVNALSTLDQQGIKDGIVKEGMTKEAVEYAIGFPPKHRTPSLDGNEWLYWKSRFNTFKVQFKDNVVSKIID